MSEEAGGIEAADFMPGPRYVDQNIRKLRQVEEEEDGKRPPHCLVCMRILTSKNTRTAWVNDPRSAYSFSSTSHGDYIHQVQIGPVCWKKLLKAEKETVEMMKKYEGLTQVAVLHSDEEAYQPGTDPLISWGDAVQKYGLNPMEQDAFLCFLRAHGHPAGNLPPKQMDVLYHHWREYEEERNESRVTRRAGQLPWEALTEGYFLSGDEADSFLAFLESRGFKKTTRLPVMEALFHRYRQGA